MLSDTAHGTACIKNNQYNMKRLAIAVIVVGLILGGIYIYKASSKVEYVKSAEPEATSTPKVQTIEVLERRINDAIQASSTATEVESYKAYTDTKEQIEKEIELKVTSQYRAEIEAREAKLEKEVSL